MDNDVSFECPRVKPWSERANSLQYIPMGDVGLKEALSITLSAVASGADLSAPAYIPGAKDTMSIADTCVRLNTTGLVARDTQSGGWTLTKEAAYWLDSKDDMYLAAILCSNVRFCGEQLANLQTPKTERELRAIAVSDYGMLWKTNSEIHARNDWFRSLGMVQHYEHSHQYELTDKGRAMLSTIDVATPQDIARETAQRIIPSPEPSAWALDICDLSEAELEVRETSISHICGRASDIALTLSRTISFLNVARTIDEFDEFTMREYRCSETSSQSYRSTLRVLGLLEDCPGGMRSTDVANRWNEAANPTDLACYLHSRRRFVFELLKALEDGSKNRKDLTTAALVLYGCVLNRDNLGKRINVLRNAGLLVGERVFEITEAGVNILKKVSIEQATVANSSSPELAANEQVEPAIPLQGLLMELHQAAQDSEHFERFENACADAFKALGFRSKHVGKSGRTDVLVTAQCAARFAYNVVVDAKSTKHPTIGINDINFDSIDKHRRENKAAYAVVVARGFSDASVVEFAKKHNAVLLSVDTLCQLIEEHASAPISSQDYSALFASPGLADVSTIEPARKEVRRYGELLRGIMNCLSSESDEEEYGGIMTVQAIRAWMRGNPDIEMNPGVPEISTMLELCSSPMIGCVGKKENYFGKGLDGYYAIGSLSEAANKFAFYMQACR